MFKQPSQINFNIPRWIDSYCNSYCPNPTIEKKMEFVIEASKKNIQHGTGGPFAAAVFDIDTDQLISLGTNIVTTQNLSILHAEMVALSLAQKKLNTYDLSISKSKYLLVSSSEPCAMCLGAICWSGIKIVATGAKDKDIRAIGFDEGDKIKNWKKSLEKRKIQIFTEVKRTEAVNILKQYKNSEGKIYNPSNF